MFEEAKAQYITQSTQNVYYARRTGQMSTLTDVPLNHLVRL